MKTAFSKTISGLIITILLAGLIVYGVHADGELTAGTYDDTDASILYAGDWSAESDSNAYSTTTHIGANSGSSTSLSFYGTGVTLLYTVADVYGQLNVSIDGTPVTSIDQYNLTQAWQQSWTSSSLSYGAHTLQLAHSGGTGSVNLDAVIILDESDHTAPAAIANLATAPGATDGSVTLTWSAPGNDGSTGTATSYFIRYSTAAIDDQAAWDAATVVSSGIPAPLSAGSSQSMEVTGLTSGQTYYFAIRAQDEAGNISGISNSPFATAPDRIAPAAITDLVAATGSNAGTVVLTWTAPGDDGNTGKAQRYSICYFTSAITSETRWESASYFLNSYVPQTAGQSESITITRLTPGQKYYFAVRASDESAHMAGLSNSPSALSQALLPGTYDDRDTSAIQYTGSWSNFSDSGYYYSTYHKFQAGASATFTFTGTRFQIIYAKSSTFGSMSVRVDLMASATIDQYSPTTQLQQVWSSSILSPGNHTVSITFTSGDYANLDAIIIRPDLDGVPPAAINDLTATSAMTTGAVNLTWTAVGDDGNNGTASSYLIRYSSIPIVDENTWNTAAAVPNDLSPKAPGQTENFTIFNLPPGQIYYFAVRTRDEEPNLGGLSNSPEASSGVTDVTFTISGNVGVGGAILKYYDREPKYVVADGSGNYSINVSYSWSGMLVPTLTGYKFSPATRELENLLTDQSGQDFSVTPITCDISEPVDNYSLLSQNQSGVKANQNSFLPRISSNGCFAVFTSDATNLVSGDTNKSRDVFVRNLSTGEIVRASVSTDGTQSDIFYQSSADGLSISADGRYVVFSTNVTNLIENDTNGVTDVYMHDMHTGITTRVSVSSSGQEGNFYSEEPSISADGRYVVFTSGADNLISGDTNDWSDIFVHDTWTGVTFPASISSEGALGNQLSVNPSISANGRYVVYETYSTNLASNDPYIGKDVYMYDITTGTTTLVSIRLDGNGPGNYSSYSPRISADGRVTAFTSSATNLINGDTNNHSDIFLRDMLTGITKCVSMSTSGIQANGASAIESLSADGRFVVFLTSANNLAGDDTDILDDFYLHDNTVGVSRLIRPSHDGGSSDAADISATGNRIVFWYSFDIYSYKNDITSPTTSGIAAVNVMENAAPTNIDLWGAFEDSDTDDSKLVFTVVGNSNPGLFTSVQLPAPGNPYLTLNYAPDVNGTSTLTIRATNPAGLYVETNFLVTITDIIIPATILDLATVPGATHGSVSLTWSAPGDNGSVGTAESYLVRYALSPITDQASWEAATVVASGIPAPLAAGSSQSMEVSGLIPEQAYYFAIRTVDDGANTSELSNSPNVDAPDLMPPAAISDLTVESAIPYQDLILTWTAPGDDGFTGKASSYIIRYAPGPILTENDWNNASYFGQGTPAPVAGGTIQTTRIYSLLPGKTYYVAIRVRDNRNNLSPLSNSPYAVTADPLSSGTYDDTSPKFTYDGDWTLDPSFLAAYNSTVHLSNTIGDSVTFTITTNQRRFVLIYSQIGYGTTLDIYIDNVKVDTLNTFSIMEIHQNKWYSPLFGEGRHVIKLVNSGGATIVFDGIQILPFDPYRPATITDLVATPSQFPGAVDLTWTASGDDNKSGVPTWYVIRYSTNPILSETDWANATSITKLVSKPALQEGMMVRNLIPEQQYYFAVRAMDEVNNLGGLSNSPGAIPPDLIPPAYIPNLQAIPGATNGSVTLTWSAPGDDGSTGTATSYLVRYSLTPIIYQSSWGTATPVSSGIPIPLTAGSSQSMDVTGLEPGRVYYFVIRAVDNVDNVGGLSNSAGSQAADLTPPAVITDLAAAPGATDGSVTLTWSAPGDDGSTGTATSYLVRVSTDPITDETSWSAATLVGANVPTPAAAGTSQSMTVSGLNLGQPFHFAIRAVDDAGNTAGLSNSPSSEPLTPAHLDEGLYQQNSSAAISYSGAWMTLSSPNASGGSYRTASGSPASAQFTFIGTRFKVIYANGPSYGRVNVQVDGSTIATLSQNSKKTKWQQTWTSPILPYGLHIVRLVLDSGSAINLDAIRIVGASDITPPAAITNLAASTGTEVGSISLTWSAPGDDGVSGTATSYLIRYSFQPITSPAAWNAATPVTTGIPRPVTAGSVQSLTLGGLPPSATLYFAIRAADEEGNLAGLSNSPSARVMAPTAINAGSYEDTAAAILYSGRWTISRPIPASARTLHVSRQLNDAAQITFDGTRFSLSYAKGPDYGVLTIYIDGVLTTTINQYNRSRQWQATWTSPLLSAGTHTIRIVHSRGTLINIDAFQVAN